MPSPSTTDLPRPKSWDELEDICADILKRNWKDPYITRYGRTGQSQDGVDIYGQPEHLGGQKYAGAQCKEADTITFQTIKKEVEKAKNFKPLLAEYVVMTTAPRDARLQEAIRNHTWPFRVAIRFWDDISLDISGYDDLLQKHFPGWLRKITTKEHVRDLLLSSQPEDYDYNGKTGEFYLTKDINLRIVEDRSDVSERDFDEPWVREFPDPKGTRQPIHIYYDKSMIYDLTFVNVDGGRYTLPLPKSRDVLLITPLQYHIGKIINRLASGITDFDFALRLAGITIEESHHEQSD